MTEPAAPRPAGGDPAVMAARYGGVGSGRRGLILAGVVTALLVAGGLAVQASNLTRPTVMAENVGFTVNDASSTTVRFNLRTDPGTTVSCTLVALNESFTQVGFREVELGPFDEPATSHQVDVTTTELATTGSVDGCQILDEG
ncbi:DUF4307 domain-containing protein [Georgenia sp. EYE_87]|uniref:DUF4307 domain-containing protein n=1 Tax=Georgenia sp. EYE_87 TaxID=2853448 RepID=UPI002004F5DF|nr:DUF4307 domain-containing protein [Georgenia sp. EYE_87]MCK6210980.1 DUF4307 domain-containing protein [Georgenia sp. EYE_87]